MTRVMFLDAVLRPRAPHCDRKDDEQYWQRMDQDSHWPASTSSYSRTNWSSTKRIRLPVRVRPQISLFDNVARQDNAHDVCNLSRETQPNGFTDVHFNETLQCVYTLRIKLPPQSALANLNLDIPTFLPTTMISLENQQHPPNPAPPSQSAGAHESRDYYASQAVRHDLRHG